MNPPVPSITRLDIIQRPPHCTAPVSKGTVSATARIISMSRTLAVVHIAVVNEGRLAAVAQGTVTIRDPKK